MGTMVSQITSLTIVYHRKHQKSASLAFVWGIHRWPVNSPQKRPVTRKMSPFEDVIMVVSCGISWLIHTPSKKAVKIGHIWILTYCFLNMMNFPFLWVNDGLAKHYFCFPVEIFFKYFDSSIYDLFSKNTRSMYSVLQFTELTLCRQYSRQSF